MLMMLGDPGADSTSKKKDQNETYPGNQRTLQIWRLQKEVQALKTKIDISRKMYDIEEAVRDLKAHIANVTDILERHVTDNI